MCIRFCQVQELPKTYAVSDANSVSSRRRREKTGISGLRDDFLAWRCRIRQTAMRADGGRPSPGMRPRVLDDSGGDLAPALTVLLVPRAPEESTAFSRFRVMRSDDPRDLYQRGLAYLQADYFHRSQSLRPDDGGARCGFRHSPQYFSTRNIAFSSSTNSRCPQGGER